MPDEDHEHRGEQATQGVGVKRGHDGLGAARYAPRQQEVQRKAAKDQQEAQIKQADLQRRAQKDQVDAMFDAEKLKLDKQELELDAKKEGVRIAATRRHENNKLDLELARMMADKPKRGE